LRSFIAQINKFYPHAKIVLTIGMICVQKVAALISKVCQEYTSDVFLFQFNSLSVGGFMPMAAILMPVCMNMPARARGFY
jgi:hypothetical protein